jgi:probable Rubsico expression protein CbbX
VSNPLYRIPGTAPATDGKPSQAAEAVGNAAAPDAAPLPRTVAGVLASSHVEDVLDELERDLVGLAPVKQRIRDIAALLVIDKLRLNLGLAAQSPSLHMSFTGNPGTGKTTVAMRMAQILHRLGYVRKGHLVAVTRDDLVGQYIGHTAPKTREVLKKAMGGVLFIDEAYYLYRPDNERDYGQEAIEILLQVMENQRDDLVVILAGYADRMDTFFRSNPGMSSRIAHHLEFPDYSGDELLQIAERMLAQQNYRFGAGAREAFAQYLAQRVTQPHFANARSVRNALDRARLRQASRLFADRDRELTLDDLSTIAEADIRASRVFGTPAAPSTAAPSTAAPSTAETGSGERSRSIAGGSR